MSLWFYLMFRKAGYPPGLAEPQYGLSSESLNRIRRLGEDLATRPGMSAPELAVEEEAYA